MPELPEVETVVRGLAPALVGRSLRRVEVRQPRLRWPVPVAQLEALCGARVRSLTRRAKYLLFGFESGTLIGHLGMTGCFRFCKPTDPWEKHEHLQLEFTGGQCLRYQDARRFGALLWQKAGHTHPLLADLGPEPLGPDFTPEALLAAVAGRRQALKVVLMDAAVVVGVGNIYASEACFLAKLPPTLPAGRLRADGARRLVRAVKQVLGEAIAAGGTTLRDFRNAEAMPGYFARELRVYGRAGEPCRTCGTPIRRRVQGQRSTYWCPKCQAGRK